jgi:hypothetical protein
VLKAEDVPVTPRFLTAAADRLHPTSFLPLRIVTRRHHICVDQDHRPSQAACHRLAVRRFGRHAARRSARIWVGVSGGRDLARLQPRGGGDSPELESRAPAGRDHFRPRGVRLCVRPRKEDSSRLPPASTCHAALFHTPFGVRCKRKFSIPRVPTTGVSIVRDSNRVYQLTVWGEDPDTDHWLRIGLLPIGRGTQSSLRTIAKAFLLPVALAVDVAVIPLACAVVWAGVFLATGRSVPMTLTVLGVVFLAAYPLVRICEVRERADIDRALSLLVDAPLDSLRSTDGREFELTVPSDSQWRRIVRRMGPPAFLAVAATTEEMRNRHTDAASDVGLSLRVTRNGSPVTLIPTSDTPYAHSAYTQNNGFKFTAEAGDRIALWTRVTGSQLSPKSNLILVADWGNLNTWDWVDGAAMGYGLLTLVSSVAAALGLALIGGGVVIGWRRRSRCEST